jgi:hypothetical protein
VTRRRANGEGSFFPYRNGFAAYVWITTPSGKRQRKYVYRTNSGDRPQPVDRAHAEAARGPVVRCRQLGSSSIDGSKTRLLRILPRSHTRHMRAT